MISQATEKRLRKLFDEQPTYQPNQGIVSQIKDTSVIAFVGASCMGKTTIMQELVRSNPKFGEIIVFTSREPRVSDNPDRYTYYEHTDEGLAGLLERIEKKEVLQYNINPFNLHIYGSEADGYPHTHNTGDIFATSIDGFRQLGFGSLHVFSVITTPELWLQRFKARFPLDDPNRQARLLEAEVSLKWSLGQTSEDHSWIVNSATPKVAADKVEEIIGVMKQHSNEEAVALAQGCLGQIQELLT